MGARDTVAEWLRQHVPAWIYACTYAFVVAVALTCVALLFTLLTGGDLVRAKLFLFFGGWILLAIATAQLWPQGGSEDEPVDSYDEAVGTVAPDSRMQRIANAIPPARWVRRPPPPERVSMAGKQFLAAVATLAVSFLVEAVGIA